MLKSTRSSMPRPPRFTPESPLIQMLSSRGVTTIQHTMSVMALELPYNPPMGVYRRYGLRVRPFELGDQVPWRTLAKLRICLRHTMA
jgi:hypothetical protein